jgi:exopolyphosphatase/pppGpp-phosphohydrolase
LAGGAILYFAMEKLEAPSVLISCHGVRHGLIYKKFHILNCKSQIEKSKT